MQPSSGAYARLIGLFLEGVARPQRFAEGLRLLAELFSLEQVSVRIWDRRGNWACMRDARRMNRAWHQTTDDALTINPEWHWLASTLEPGRWQRLRVLHDRSRASGSVPPSVALNAASLGLRLTLQNGADGLLVLRTAADRHSKTDAIPLPSDELIKSLQSAMELTAQLRQLHHRLAYSHILLNAIRLPLLLLDPAMRLLAANSHAQPLMEYESSGSGRRCINLRGLCEIKFSNAVRSACGISSRAAGSIVRTSSAPALQIIVLPIAIRHAIRSERVALILVQGWPEKPETQDCVNQLLKQVYGLTPAEARLAILILDGLSPVDAASNLKVSVATVRTQLSSILKKTGSRKQAELIRHLSPLMVLNQPPLVF